MRIAFMLLLLAIVINYLFLLAMKVPAQCYWARDPITCGQIYQIYKGDLQKWNKTNQQ